MLDKSIANGREHRKPFYGSKAVDKSCRCHGSCDFCRNNRLHKYNLIAERMSQAEADFGRKD